MPCGVAESQMIGRHAGRFGRDGRDFDALRQPRILGNRAPCCGPHVGFSRMAATSSVRSMATGHQVMHRPQPTQPETSN